MMKVIKPTVRKSKTNWAVWWEHTIENGDGVHTYDTSITLKSVRIRSQLVDLKRTYLDKVKEKFRHGEKRT